MEYLNVMFLVKYVPNWIIASAACLGLFTWKGKVSYERKMSIVDDFHDTVYDFILKIDSSILILECMKSGMQSHEETFQSDAHQPKSFTSGLHEFIEKSGKSYSVRLNDRLKNIPMQHIYTLITKLDVLKTKDRCLAINSCKKQLKWVYGTIQQIANLLGMKSLYWGNPEVAKIMSPLNELNIEELKESLNHIEEFMLEFARKNYK